MELNDKDDCAVATAETPAPVNEAVEADTSDTTETATAAPDTHDPVEKTTEADTVFANAEDPARDLYLMMENQAPDNNPAPM